MLAACIALIAPVPAPAQTGAERVRIVYFNTELARDGPGLLYRDILRADPQVLAVARTLAHLSPDIAVLSGVDWDHEGRALDALARRIAEAGHPMPHVFAGAPNAGAGSGLDLDGDGRRGGPGDAQGYGRFRGEGALAVLSRHPIAADDLRDFSGLAWLDLPDNHAPEGTAPGQRLSSNAHWDLPVRIGATSLRLLIWHATPPVFDGPRDRNGRRNHDEAALWLAYLRGRLAQPPPESRFIVLGDANLDPADGDGRTLAIRTLLAHPALQDPAPRSRGAALAAAAQGGPNAAQRGDPALDTADWFEDPGDWDRAAPGNLRVDYILPSRDLQVRDAGVFWPVPDTPDAAVFSVDGTPASRHHPVWVDIDIPGRGWDPRPLPEHPEK